MKETISARIYFAPDEPGRLYMERHYRDDWTAIRHWCPPHVTGGARSALLAAMSAIGAKHQTIAGIKEMIYKIELNSNYRPYGKIKFPFIIPVI